MLPIGHIWTLWLYMATKDTLEILCYDVRGLIRGRQVKGWKLKVNEKNSFVGSLQIIILRTEYCKLPTIYVFPASPFWPVMYFCEARGSLPHCFCRSPSSRFCQAHWQYSHVPYPAVI